MTTGLRIFKKDNTILDPTLVQMGAGGPGTLDICHCLTFETMGSVT